MVGKASFPTVFMQGKMLNLRYIGGKWMSDNVCIFRNRKGVRKTLFSVVFCQKVTSYIKIVYRYTTRLRNKRSTRAITLHSASLLYANFSLVNYALSARVRVICYYFSIIEKICLNLLRYCTYVLSYMCIYPIICTCSQKL